MTGGGPAERQAGAKPRIGKDVVTLTALERAPLIDPAGERLGNVEDVIVRLADGGYPPVTGLKVRLGGRDLFVPAASLSELAPAAARLNVQTVNLGRFQRRPGEVLLREDVLDRRLIDVVGGHLVNANDLLLASIDGWWRLVGVDPSRRTLLGRLLPRSLRRREGEPPRFIDWNDVEPFVGHVPTARLLLPLGRLKRLHPAQIADLVEHSSHEQGEEIIAAVGEDPELTADVFEELDTEHQLEFLRSRSDEEAARVLAEMEPDDAADLLAELEQDRRLAVLARVPSPQHEKLQSLMRYNPTTAGGMMSPDFIAVKQGASTDLALQGLRVAREVPVQLLGNVFVTDAEGAYLGLISAVHLIRAPAGQAVEDLEEFVRVSVKVEDDLQDVALIMADYNLTAVGVEDGEGRLVGAISVDDVLEALVPDAWRRRAENEGD